MPPRIRLSDLPSRCDSDADEWLLTWRCGVRGASIALPNGDSLIGSSAAGTLRLSAPGVAARHLRIRRDGDRVFVQPAGRATVSIRGKAVRALTSIPSGEEISFGKVVAVLERVGADDRLAAVRIAAGESREIAEDNPGAEPAVWQLTQLTEAIETSRGAPTIDSLAAALRGAAGARAVAVYHSKGSGDEAWAVLGASQTAGACLRPDDAGCARFQFERDHGPWLLLADFEGETPDAWRSALCRHALALAAGLSAREDGSRKARGRRHAEGADVWDGVAGQTVRAYLDSCAPVCRFCDTVLVLGETGAGKELAARGLHRLWNRSGPLVGINCAAIPADLLDAELFGIESGTATGVASRRGRLQEAEGGTLFLDEVADLPMHLQAKLLRVIQEREYYSVGGAALLRADVHIVAASNHSVPDLLAGHMRPDLYYRLSQAIIALPPLRERPEDLPALCADFLTRLERQFGRGIPGISVAALDALRAHLWPGNIRELHNLLRAVYASAPSGRVITAAQVVQRLGSGGGRTTDEPQLAAAVKHTERAAILAELQRSRSVASAARALGLSEGYLYRKLKRLGVDVHAVLHS